MKTHLATRFWKAPSGYEFQALEDTTRPSVRLWVRIPGDREWTIGHSKFIPNGMTAADVIEEMRRFTMGITTHAEYNTLVP